MGQTIVLVQVLWLRGNANGPGDVNRHFMIFERPFDLDELEMLGKSNLDVRKLKQVFHCASGHRRKMPANKSAGAFRTPLGGTEIREERDRLVIRKRETETALTQTAGEVRVLERQPSNIPSHMLDLRQDIAAAIEMSENALPFFSELIEVKPDEAEWQGSIERVRHGFALSLLVDERHYATLSNHINSHHLGQRLIYYRTGHVEHQPARPVGTDSLVLKLNIKKCHQSEWLSIELRRRFDYACVDSVQAFRRTDRALTKEGQVKHRKTRHEKDDRRSIGDRRYWVLGFDNREKLALYRKQAQELAGEISDLDGQIRALSEKENARAKRAIHCQTLVNLQWQEVDVAPLLVAIDKLQRRIRDVLEGNRALQDVADRIERQKKDVNDADKALRKTTIEYEKVVGQVREDEEALEKLRDDPHLVPLTPWQ